MKKTATEQYLKMLINSNIVISSTIIRFISSSIIRNITKPSSRFMVSSIIRAFNDSINCNGKISNHIISMDGMSGKKYRYFINNLILLIPNVNYMEIGSWKGSTLCSAMYGNTLNAVAIDNWSQFGNPVTEFLENIKYAITSNTNLKVIEQDYRNVDYSYFSNKINIFFYDGPHSMQDQYDAVALTIDAMDNEFIFIVDDWNLKDVRDGTLSAIANLGLNIVFSIEIYTTIDDSLSEINSQHSDWHNGYYISVLEKHI